MKAQEKEEKDLIKFRFAVALNKALQDSELNSFRRLAKEAGMEPSHVQKISVGKLDISFTKCIALADALKLSYSLFFNYYESVTPKDIKEYKETLLNQKALKGTKTKSVKRKK